MSNLVPNTEMSPFLKALMEQDTDNSQKQMIDALGGTSYDRLGRIGKAFRFTIDGEAQPIIKDDEGKVVQSVLAIILDSTFPVKAWFEKPWGGDDAEPTLPDCFSSNGRFPDSSVASPQSFSCQKCPKNVFGSNGRKGKACSDHVQLAILLPDEEHWCKVYNMRVTPDELKNYKKYLKEVDKKGYKLKYVVTEITFVDSHETHPTFDYSFFGFIPNPEQVAPEIDSIIENNKDDIDGMLGRNAIAMTREEYEAITGEASGAVETQPDIPQENTPAKKGAAEDAGVPKPSKDMDFDKPKTNGNGKSGLMSFLGGK